LYLVKPYNVCCFRRIHRKVLSVDTTHLLNLHFKILECFRSLIYLNLKIIWFYLLCNIKNPSDQVNVAFTQHPSVLTLPVPVISLTLPVEFVATHLLSYLDRTLAKTWFQSKLDLFQLRKVIYYSKRSVSRPNFLNYLTLYMYSETLLLTSTLCPSRQLNSHRGFHNRL